MEKRMPQTITEAEIRSHGVTMDGLTACKAVYGVSRTKAYQLLRSGNVDFPVRRVGNRFVVPTSAVLRLLGLEAGSAE
jgi:hypothetical protein